MKTCGTRITKQSDGSRNWSCSNTKDLGCPLGDVRVKHLITLEQMISLRSHVRIITVPGKGYCIEMRLLNEIGLSWTK